MKKDNMKYVRNIEGSSEVRENQEVRIYSKRKRGDSLERDLQVLENHRSRNNSRNKLLTQKLTDLYTQLNHVIFQDTNRRSRRQILEGAVDYIKWLKEQIQR